MKKTMSSLLGILLLVVAGPSQAILIEAVPTTSQVTLGNQATVDINISGLGANTAPSLGAYDIDIGFDPSVLSFDHVTFGSGLDVLGLGSIQGVDTSVSGLVNLFEVSLDSVADLETFQPASFTLASLTFDTLSIGVSPVSLSVNTIGDALGLPLEAVTAGARIAAVPEPSTLMLMFIGMTGFVLTLRRRKYIAKGEANLS